MRFERMALFAIAGESFATLLFAGFVGAYKLGDPRESRGTLWNLVAQIDEQITAIDCGGTTRNTNGRLCCRLCRGEHFVWHETAVAKRPEKVIQPPRVVVGGCVDMHRVIQPIRFLRESASESKA